MSNTAVMEKNETKKPFQAQASLRAPIAIYESEESYTVLVDLLGADEKTIRVNVHNGQLRVEAELKTGIAPSAVQRYSEIRLGNYVRILDFKDGVDEDGVQATFCSGILTVTLAKSKSSKPRKIAVKAG